MFDWISKIFTQKEQIEQLQFNLNTMEQESISNKLLISGMECEIDKKYELAIKHYQESTNVWHNPQSEVHIAICLAALGDTSSAKVKLKEIREKGASAECDRVGRLLEEGFFGAPDYHEARRWYMSESWYAPNSDSVIQARNNLKRIMHEYDFEDHCCKCGRSLKSESIFFINSDFEQGYCNSCMEIAPFVYTLNPLTGEMNRATYNFSL